jgi:hypothetical protein
MTNAVNIASLGPAMSADSSGNVGVGTTSPATKLHVSDTTTSTVKARTQASTGYVDVGMGGNSGVFDTTASDGIRLRLSGSDKLSIDSSGRVTTPSQTYLYFRPSCTSSSGDFNIASGVVSQGGMAYSTSARTITVPIAGVYMITWQTICTNSSARTDTALLYNGANLTQGLSENNGDGYHQRTHTIAYKMNANDYLSLNNANWYNVNGDPGAWSTFSIYLLG